MYRLFPLLLTPDLNKLPSITNTALVCTRSRGILEVTKVSGTNISLYGLKHRAPLRLRRVRMGPQEGVMLLRICSGTGTVMMRTPLLPPC